MLRTLKAGAMLFAVSITGFALAQAPPPPPQSPATDPDSQIVTDTAHPKTKAQLIDDAWKQLSDALADQMHVDTRIQPLAALGTMGSNPKSSKMIESAFADAGLDVRTAAVLAAGQTKNAALGPGIRKLLDDKEPQVAFAAASTLWKMGDRSGADLLMAVVDGDRKANPSLVHGSMHQANRELHDPAALAKFGAMQGASMLLGPFGFGITAYEYAKKNGGDSARVTAIEEIAQVKSPAVRKELLDSLTDKDPAVRASAAKAIRGYRDVEVSTALAMLFADSKKPVALVGAASYLISVGAVALPPPVRLTV